MTPKKNPARKKTTRAHSGEQKLLVREAIIEAGRELWASTDFLEISLRRIAAHAGYSPGTIYQYFADKRDLFIVIRERDMSDALSEFERIATLSNDPEETLKNVFLGVAIYWSKNFDHFHILFSNPPGRPMVRKKNGELFGRSELVKRSYALFQKVTKEFLNTLPFYPLSLKTATDMLIAVTHGTVSFPVYTRTMRWTDPIKLVRGVIEAILTDWKIVSQKKRKNIL